jgi:predicted ABC-type ATPase
MKRLDLVVGCNGAGKSSFIELTLAPLLPGSAVVNADEIAKHRWPDTGRRARVRGGSDRGADPRQAHRTG